MTIKDIKKSLVVFLAIFGLFSSAKVFATTYSYDVDVQFNFNSKLAVTITDADIKILDLAPGTSADSNIVGITISTNNVAGYTAEATVGNAQNATTNMTHTNSTNTFTSIATNASQASLTTDNTWGYAVSTDNGSSWSNFSGLPVYTEDGKELASTDSPASDAIKFKINAKAATSQPAGDYTNVINFKVVANTPPRDWKDVLPPDYCTTHPTECDSVTGLVTMQSMNESICGLVEEVDSEFQFTDTRDHKTYWVAKLRDGKCWMTQNLDHDIDTTKTYDNTNTDIGYNGVTYSTASWQPTSNTVPEENISANGGITSGWIGNGNVPDSVDLGDWYYTDTWASSDVINYVDWASSGNVVSRTPFDANGTHGHVGNLYNWPAAVAVNNTATQEYVSYTYDSYNPAQNPKSSICPSGWRLPVISLYTAGQDDDNEFYNLVRHYKNNLSGDSSLVSAAPLWFTRVGYSSGVLFNMGYGGYYWSGTMNGSGYAYNLELNSSSSVGLQSSWSRNMGFSIRCVSRDQDKLTIKFDANGGTGASSTQRVNYGVTTPLRTNTFTRAGYAFNGWNTNSGGQGDGYADGGSFRAPKNTLANTHITLYAQWVPENEYSGAVAGGVTIAQAYELAYTEHGKSAYKGHFKMQDIDLTYNNVKVCDLVTVIGDVYPAIDERDDTIYEITKAPDGRCWMMNNLALDITDSNVQNSMNSNNTNATNGALNYLFSGGGTTSDRYATAGVIRWTSGNSYSAPLANADYKNYTNKNIQSPYDKFMPADDWKYGVFYNYCAASAGTYCYGDGDEDYGTAQDLAGTAVDSEYDICPKAWRLPTGLSVNADRPDGGEQMALYDSYNGATDKEYGQVSDYVSYGSQRIAFRKGVKMNMPGTFTNGSVSYQASSASYWSSTYNTDNGMDSMYMSAYGTSSSNYMRYIGLSIRCIAK